MENEVKSEQSIVREYFQFLSQKAFPCVAAKAAVKKNHIKCLVVDHMACPAHDSDILAFMYDFVDEYRGSTGSYHSAGVIFRQPAVLSEQAFDQLLWDRLKKLSNMDRAVYPHDNRVDPDPASPRYSYSLKSEAFFIVGLHPASQRKSRRFNYPALVFNPHAEFEKLRSSNRYEKLKQVVRNRDIIYSGSVNPVLDDFGNTSEVNQYTGVSHDSDWRCPLSQ